MTARGDYFPRRVNLWFANAKYAQDVGEDGMCKCRIPALAALNAIGILSAQSIATAVDTSTFLPAFTQGQDQMGKFGRNVTVVASGAATSNVTVYGTDYLGQPVAESFTLNGTTPVVGKKAFRYVNRITATVTAATTINVGWGNALGLPYKLQKLDAEFVTAVAPANAGTTVAGSVATQTSTTDDPRGTYTPHASVVPDGVRYYDLVSYMDNNNLYGVQHFGG